MQLPLGFNSEVDFSHDNFFVSSSNAEAISWIEKWSDWSSHCTIIYGPEGCGKTHIASIWQKNSDAKFLDGANLGIKSLGEGKNFVVEYEDHIEKEEDLFHLYNYVKEKGGYLLITSRVAPKNMGITLPDLESRMGASMQIKVDEPDDQLLQSLLLKQFSDRQIKINKDVLSFLVLRIERSFLAVKELVEKIDSLSLEQKRNITVPFVKEVLEK